MKVLSLCSKVESVHIGEVQILKMWLKGHSQFKNYQEGHSHRSQSSGVHINEAPNIQ